MRVCTYSGDPRLEEQWSKVMNEADKFFKLSRELESNIWDDSRPDSLYETITSEGGNLSEEEADESYAILRAYQDLMYAIGEC